MTNELIKKAKECKSAEELLALAKENGIEMTTDEAAVKFAELNNEGELSDEELDGAAGGGCGKEESADELQVGDQVKFYRPVGWNGNSNYKCQCGGNVYFITEFSHSRVKMYAHLECCSCGKLYLATIVSRKNGSTLIRGF